jgi:hypothetical protein
MNKNCLSLSLDVLSLLKSDPIVELLLALTTRTLPLRNRWGTTTTLTRRVCRDCCDRVLRRLAVRHSKYLIKYNRFDVYTFFWCAAPGSSDDYFLAHRYHRNNFMEWLQRRITITDGNNDRFVEIVWRIFEYARTALVETTGAR